MNIKYGNNDVTEFVDSRPSIMTGFDFLSDFGLALNDISVSLPLKKFKDIVKKGGTVTVDDVFVGYVYDIKKNFETQTLDLTARQRVYDMTLAQSFTYSATSKNPVVAIREIIEQFIDASYIDDISFNSAAALLSDVSFKFAITETDNVAPLNIIATINELCGLALYIDKNKLKIYYVKDVLETGGIEITSELKIKDGVTTSLTDYRRDRIVLNYTDLTATERTTTAGTGALSKALDISPTITMTTDVAQIVVDRLLEILNRDYEQLEIVVIKSELFSVGKIVIFDDIFYIIKNIAESSGEFTLTGIGVRV